MIAILEGIDPQSQDDFSDALLISYQVIQLNSVNKIISLVLE